jgi:uncharacterized membrane protein
MTRKNQNLPHKDEPQAATVENNETAVAEKHENHPTVLEPEVTKAIQFEIRKVVRETYSGPMPKPDHLEKYDQIVPGAARDILEEFKANGAHSRKIEYLAITGAVNNDKRGQWMAFVLLAMGFGLIAYLANINQASVAKIVAGTLLVAVIGGYLSNKFLGKRNTTDTSETSEP